MVHAEVLFWQLSFVLLVAPGTSNQWHGHLDSAHVDELRKHKVNALRRYRTKNDGCVIGKPVQLRVPTYPVLHRLPTCTEFPDGQVTGYHEAPSPPLPRVLWGRGMRCGTAVSHIGGGERGLSPGGGMDLRG
jgi:hypothetical protein